MFQLCEQASKEINQQAAWALSKFTLKERLFNEYELDFSLTRTPEFNTSVGIDTFHKVAIDKFSQNSPKVQFQKSSMKSFHAEVHFELLKRHYI